MNKSELAQRAADATNITITEAVSAIDASFVAIADELAAGREVTIADFGKFSTTDRPAREGRNPSNGQTIQIAASTSAKFSAAAGLKRHLNA